MTLPIPTLNEQWQHLIELDQKHVWHPYAKTPNPEPPIPVKSTQGSLITLANDQQLVDGMSSWWAALHGYNHPTIQQAMHEQIETMPHIMFGGLTHEPAILLAKKLVDLTPPPLQKVFFVDSGSVAMEVAIKMALQYWISRGSPEKNKLLTVKHGYHGDTFATMAVCDPINGMHHLFSQVLPQHFFAPAPEMGFARQSDNQDLHALHKLLEQNHQQIAAITIEPIVQGAGGMRFYRPDYLSQLRQLADEYNVLLIADEIATGFGRTGKLFACEWANICPDIMALGKTLTGGHISLAATLTTQSIADTLNQGTPGILAHGPTFMANPLACRAALANIDVLLASSWQANIAKIEQHFTQAFTPLKQTKGVKDVRVLGGIGVIELENPQLGSKIQAAAIKENIWIRPFGKLIYTMPAYNIPDSQLLQLSSGIKKAVLMSLKDA